MSGMWLAIGGIFAVIVLAIAVISLVDIFRNDLTAGRTAAWVIIVLLLPLVGSALYWRLREPSRTEVEHQADAERALRESARRRSTGLG